MVYNDGALYCNNEFVCKKVYTRIFLTLHLHRTKEGDLVRDMGGFAEICSRGGVEVQMARRWQIRLFRRGEVGFDV